MAASSWTRATQLDDPNVEAQRTIEPEHAGLMGLEQGPRGAAMRGTLRHNLLHCELYSNTRRTGVRISRKFANKLVTHASCQDNSVLETGWGAPQERTIGARAARLGGLE